MLYNQYLLIFDHGEMAYRTEAENVQRIDRVVYVGWVL